jgi:hypothetical protein
VDGIQLRPDPRKIQGINPRLSSALAAVTAALLLISVALRLVQDIPFFRAAGPLTDPVVAALVIVEAGPLGAGAFLGLAAALLAWLGWTGRVRSGSAVGIVFGLELTGGLFLGIRGYTPAQQVGWALVLLSAATLITYFWVHKSPLSH